MEGGGGVHIEDVYVGGVHGGFRVWIVFGWWWWWCAWGVWVVVVVCIGGVDGVLDGVCSACRCV